MAISDDLQAKAADLVKRALTASLGAVFLTEENLRTLVSEIKLPKELISGFLESANKTKREFLQNLSNDVLTRVMEKVNLQDLVQEILDKNEIELNVKVKFNSKKKK